VRVDHPGDDGEARAVDALGAVGRGLDDPAAGDGDVGAAEVARADVDETVCEYELRQRLPTVATLVIAPVPISSSLMCRGKPSPLRTGATARASATSSR
jgi:hypothetical protein